MVDARLPCLREPYSLSWMCRSLLVGIMTASCWSLPVAGAADSSTSISGTLHLDLFPPRHEYDYEVLDPYNMFGSPRGGFSRATLSRLAALPLHLPPVPEQQTAAGVGGDGEDVDPTVYYTTVRGADGRQYACRLYHEDALDPLSLDDSLFEFPKIRVTTRSSSSSSGLPEEEQDAVDTGGATTSSSLSSSGGPPENDEASDGTSATTMVRRSQPASSEQHSKGISSSGGHTTTSRLREDNLHGTSGDGPGTMTINADGSMQLHEETSSNGIDDDITEKSKAAERKTKTMTLSEKDVEDRLIALDGFCAHIHLGWWSTEWCGFVTFGIGHCVILLHVLHFTSSF